MSEAVVKYEPNVQVIEHSNNLPAPVVSNEQWAMRRKQFNDFVNTQLKSGVDYGVIPGTNKPSLLKPGAEKVLQLFGCAPMLEETRHEQNPETGYYNVEIVAKAVSLNSGLIVGMGIGSCSSYESKYRWRWEYWNSKGVPPEGEGWEKGYSKKTKSNFWRKRSTNPDLIDVWNTVLKMGKKRALIDLALTISGASERFTQDIEDFVEEHETEERKSTEERAPEQPPDTEPEPLNDSPVPQGATLEQVVTELGGQVKPKTRGDKLTELDGLRKKIASIDPKGHGPFWYSGHIKSHYNKSGAPTSLDDAQLDKLLGELYDVLASVKDGAIPQNLRMPEGMEK